MYSLKTLMTAPWKWDGSHVGAIDDLISEHQMVGKYLVVFLKDRTCGFINRYDTSVPLIADELKPLFGLAKMGRHRCTVTGREAIITRYIEEEGPFSPGVLTSPATVLAIRRAYLFRWALGLLHNVDGSLWYRKYKSGVIDVTSCRDSKIGYEKTTSIITQAVLKRWFNNDWSLVNETAHHVFGGRQIKAFLSEIGTIIRRVDPNFGWWSNAIIGRLKQRWPND